MQSIEDRLRLTENRPSGFDYLRFVLATSVIAWHTIIVCYGRAAETPIWGGPWRPLPTFIVPSFFALSGFLVSASLARNTLPAFLTFRAMRIFPALAGVVFVAAILLGPSVTSVPLRQYFVSGEFSHYFLNVIADIQYTLPGVFTEMPHSAVNLQLWTEPYELESYVLVAALAIAGVIKRPYFMIGLLVSASVAICVYKLTWGHLVDLDSRPPDRMIVLAFLFGVSLYTLRKVVPYSLSLFIVAVTATWIFTSFVQTMYLAPLPLAYVTIFIGLHNPGRLFLVARGDYSYGLYLYGFPVQQTIAYAFPNCRVWYINFTAALIVAGLFAFLSWHLLESKVLAKKSAVVAYCALASASSLGTLRRMSLSRKSNPQLPGQAARIFDKITPFKEKTASHAKTSRS